MPGQSASAEAERRAEARDRPVFHGARLFVDGAAASCIAEAISLPLEVAKACSMQLQQRLRADAPPAAAARPASRTSPAVHRYVECLQHDHKTRGFVLSMEGADFLQPHTSVLAMFGVTDTLQGLEAGLQKQVLYTGLRLGLYDELSAYTEGEVPVHMKVVYAMATTGLGILIANPADVVQTKFIAHRTKPVPAPTGPLAASSAAVRPAPSVPADGGPQLAARTGSSAAAHPKAEQQRFDNSSRTRGVHTHASGGLAADTLRHGGRLRPGWASSQSSYLRHVFGHHFRWNSGIAAAAMLRRDANVSVWHTLRTQDRSAAHLRPATWRALQHIGRTLSTDSKQPAIGVQRSAKAATDALVQTASAGPKTVTGVPLQNARMAYYIIVREEGLVNGLYRGFWANFACSCVQGASEIATYDVAKTALLAAGHPDSVPVHLMSGVAAGLVATVLSNPLDVVSTRLMAAKKSQLMVGTGTMQTILQMWKREGIMSFYRGFGPNVLRIGTFNIVLWTSYEQIRRLGREH